MEKITIQLDASSIDDRREVFEIICEGLNIDLDVKAAEMKLSGSGRGYNITPDHLFSFCFLNGVTLESKDEDMVTISFIEEEKKGNDTEVPEPEITPILIDEPHGPDQRGDISDNEDDELPF